MWPLIRICLHKFESACTYYAIKYVVAGLNIFKSVHTYLNMWPHIRIRPHRLESMATAFYSLKAAYI